MHNIYKSLTFKRLIEMQSKGRAKEKVHSTETAAMAAKLENGVLSKLRSYLKAEQQIN